MVAVLAASLAFGGLHGMVVRGPTTPVCSTTEPCTEPARGAVLAFARHGRVARVVVDARGRYRVRLAPGTYAVRLVPAPRVGGIAPRTVVVRPGVDARRDFAIDTGIR
jgi:hypothetical protein